MSEQPPFFSKNELERYSRHLIIPEFNIEGQRKLKEAKVLVVGTGGLGAPLLQYLAAAGVGTIGLVDFDTVDDSNLQRQVLFTINDIGKPKVEVAAAKLKTLNPYITVNTYNAVLNSENALDIIKEYDIVADGTDNFPTRYLINDACVILRKINIYGSIFRFDGQVSVFNYNNGPNYRDLFPSPPPPGMVPSCSEGGVLGVLPGIIGSVQANEVIKVITGIGKPLSGKLFLFDALSFETRILNVRKNPDSSEIKGLIDYEEFCGTGIDKKDIFEGQSKTVYQLDEMIRNKDPFQLIDVREPYEYEISKIENAQLIPVSEIEIRKNEIQHDIPVIFVCRTGKRSGDVIHKLEKEGYQNLFNLEGGILEWSDKIDSEVAKY